jgi:hypothetical protein
MSDRDAAERLRGILGELHQVLESADDLDDSSREALRGTVDEIQSALDAEGVPQLSGLRERIERFEGSHPRLTEVVRRIVDQLSEMGI